MAKKSKINDLRKKYPKILKCWIECADGWYWIINNLCSQLQWDIDKNKEPQLVASQIKEKFGTLRFYTNGATERQNGMIDFAETLSYSICEKCGSHEATQNKKGWITTLCKKCCKEKNEEKI